MFIKGCILPVHFDDFDASGLKKGDKVIKDRSKKLMGLIRKRYKILKKKNKGNPTIVISAILPPTLEMKHRQSAIV